MTRNEFIDWLSRLVADGEMTEDDAAAWLVAFDLGTLPAHWQLPQPVSEGVRGPDETARDAALIALLLLLARPGQPPPTQLRPLPSQTATAQADAVQTAFEQAAAQLAAQLANNSLTIAAWQTALLAEVERHILQQMMLANGNQALTPAQLARLERMVWEQSAWLQRFADQAALRFNQETPWSEAYLAHRAAMYGGVGRAEFYRSGEEAQGWGEGWVIEYIAVDDRGTCSPCHNAQGLYLPGQGPYPGEICLGRGACRCRRVAQHRPEIYVRLAG